jgi:very-short-patch-repair endonuclease
VTLNVLLDRVARSQYGLVSHSQLKGLGLTRGQIDGLLRTGRLVPVRPGVHRLCGVPPSWRSTALAAVLAAGEPALLSHRSAGVLWSLFDPNRESGPLEVTSSRQHRLFGVRAHRQELAESEITKHLDIPVTTAERTLLDLGQSCPAEQLSKLCDEALRREIITVGRLYAVVERHRGRGRRRIEPIREVLADRIPGYDPGANQWEQRMDRLWERLGLPPAERQYRIRVGGRTYRADRAIVGEKIAVEWSGYDPHGFRSNFDYDSDRQSDLAAAGWQVLSFTSNSSPERIVRTVLAVVEQRRQSTAPATAAPVPPGGPAA